MAEQWQSIETAPKDGTWILLLCPGSTPIVGFWNARGWWDDGDFHDHLEGIKYWMPIPPYDHLP